MSPTTLLQHLLTPSLTPQRVRHPVKIRRIEVCRVAAPSPHVRVITFRGEDLHDFVTASFDDHLKLMLPPAPDAPLVLPAIGPPGLVMPEGAAAPILRDYTPRRWNAAAGELDIEFALHGNGPASNWARQAAPGQQLGIGGPKGSFVVPPGYDWHLLIGDESALPAIARRLEELPAGTPVIALLQIEDPADRRTFATAAAVRAHWIVGGEGALAAATAALRLPPGTGYAWAAGEASAITAVRQALVGPLGLPKQQVRAVAYWKRGVADHHERLEG